MKIFKGRQNPRIKESTESRLNDMYVVVVVFVPFQFVCFFCCFVSIIFTIESGS